MRERDTRAYRIRELEPGNWRFEWGPFVSPWGDFERTGPRSWRLTWGPFVALWGAWAYGWHYRRSPGISVLGLGRLELWWRR